MRATAESSRRETPGAAARASAAAFDLSSIPELLAAGVSEGDVGAAIDSVEAEYGNLSEKDVEELLAAQMLSDRDGGDDEFGKAEEDELIGGDDEEESE